jgi:CBS-domain-containing membrane protein
MKWPTVSPITSLMLPSMLVQRTTATLSAVMGGAGVFCAAYSFTSPNVAAPAIILLSCACALHYFCRR